MNLNHIDVKVIRRLLGGDPPYQVGKKQPTISAERLAKYLGWKDGLPWRRLEMSPDKNGARTAHPTLTRLLMLLLWYKWQHGELPDWNELEAQFREQVEQSQDAD